MLGITIVVWLQIFRSAKVEATACLALLLSQESSFEKKRLGDFFLPSLLYIAFSGNLLLHLLSFQRNASSLLTSTQQTTSPVSSQDGHRERLYDLFSVFNRICFLFCFHFSLSILMMVFSFPFSFVFMIP